VWFVYLLALIGVVTLVAGCVVALARVWTEDDEPHSDVGPAADALAAVERIHAASWEAAQRLREIEEEEAG